MCKYDSFGVEQQFSFLIFYKPLNPLDLYSLSFYIDLEENSFDKFLKFSKAELLFQIFNKVFALIFDSKVLNIVSNSILASACNPIHLEIPTLSVLIRS